MGTGCYSASFLRSEKTRLEQGRNAEPAAEDVNETLMGEHLEEKLKVAGVVLPSIAAVKN